ncbi:hypothetical protein ADUPG1_005460, partial [Aduncisulcus paluster]
GESSLYSQVEHALNDPDSLMNLRRNIEEIKTEIEPRKLGADILCDFLKAGHDEFHVDSEKQ